MPGAGDAVVLTGQSWGMRASDAEVIEASLLEPSRFASIFDRHVDPVRRFVTRRAPPDVIDDVVSDVLRIAFERRASFDQSAASALPWLYGIASNVLRHQRRSSLRYSAALRRAEGLADQPLDPLIGASDRVDASVRAKAMLACLEELRDDEREVLLLVAWEQLTPTEIAEVLGVPASTVRTRLHRARRQIRERLQAADDEREVAHDAN